MVTVLVLAAAVAVAEKLSLFAGDDAVCLLRGGDSHWFRFSEQRDHFDGQDEQRDGVPSEAPPGKGQHHKKPEGVVEARQVHVARSAWTIGRGKSWRKIPRAHGFQNKSKFQKAHPAPPGSCISDMSSSSWSGSFSSGHFHKARSGSPVSGTGYLASNSIDSSWPLQVSWKNGSEGSKGLHLHPRGSQSWICSKKVTFFMMSLLRLRLGSYPGL